MDYLRPIHLRTLPTQMPWLLAPCHQGIYQLVCISRRMDLSRGRYFE